MRIRIAALVLAALAAPAAQAQLFKCVKDGRTVYQDAPCDDAAKQSTIRAPSPAAVAPPAAAQPGSAATPAPAATAAAASGNAMEILAGFTVCAERVPNFARKYTDAFEGWKMRNAAAVSRIASEPEASQYDAKLRQERERPASEDIAEHCAGIATTVQPPVERGTPRVVAQ